MAMNRRSALAHHVHIQHRTQKPTKTQYIITMRRVELADGGFALVHQIENMPASKCVVRCPLPGVQSMLDLPSCSRTPPHLPPHATQAHYHPAGVQEGGQAVPDAPGGGDR